MNRVKWPYFDPDYETFSQRINPPKVVVDNESSDKFSLIKVDSANKHGILLEVVQVLTDLDLTIYKAYISSDGGWFMDVFHVTDRLGHKLTDQDQVEYIEQALGAKRGASRRSPEVQTCLGRRVGVQRMGEHTAIEMTGSDRAGVLSEIFAVLTNLRCNIVAAEVWTHNTRLACVVYVTDDTNFGPIDDNQRLSSMKEQLSTVLSCASSQDRGNSKGVKTAISVGLTHTDRRLHQMMFADRDYELGSGSCSTRRLELLHPNSGSSRDQDPLALQQQMMISSTTMSIMMSPEITIGDCEERDYSVVNIQCHDRPKLLFDTVCTLTDMQYVVFHGTIDCDGPKAIQEYYIRHMDGRTLDTEGEKQRVIECLKAAIQRRATEGLRLELCTSDRIGLLSEVTRIFRENGLSVTQAGVSTQGNRAVNTFYVRDMSGAPVNMKAIESIRNEIGRQVLHVKGIPIFDRACSTGTGGASTRLAGFSLGNLLKSRWDRLLSSSSSSSSSSSNLDMAKS